jgi:hypothetical protein
VLAALIVTLTRPASWAFGLAGFLAGGGLVLVAWPILVLPTPTGLQNALGGPVSTLVFGSPSPTLVLLILGASVAFVAAVLAGTWIGAWAEREGIALVLEAAADEGLATDPPDLTGGPGAGRIAVLRLLALVPPAAAMILAWQPIYDAAYHELILPSELVTPLPIRVIAAVPGPIVGVLVAWLVADAAAALGVRRMVLERRGILVGWLLGWADLVRRPHRAVGTALVGLAGLALVLAPVLLAAQTGWARVRELVADGRDPLLIVVAVLAWVALWLAGLVLAGVAAAFRAAAWTLEPPRRT